MIGDEPEITTETGCPGRARHPHSFSPVHSTAPSPPCAGQRWGPGPSRTPPHHTPHPTDQDPLSRASPGGKPHLWASPGTCPHLAGAELRAQSGLRIAGSSELPVTLGEPLALICGSCPQQDRGVWAPEATRWRCWPGRGGQLLWAGRDPAPGHLAWPPDPQRGGPGACHPGRVLGGAE